METRGRAPEKRDDPANLAPVCRPCHKRLIPSGQWRVDREGDFWIVTNVQTGENVCRRPVEPKAEKALVALHMALDLLDPRDESRRFLDLLASATDDEVRATDGHLGEMANRLRYGRMLVRHEMWLRHPLKEERCACTPRRAKAIHDVAQLCCLAENTVWEDVRAARLYIADDGMPMADSWYRVACHAPDPFEALGKAREMHGEGKSIRDFREAQGTANEPWICPTCGTRKSSPPSAGKEE